MSEQLIQIGIVLLVVSVALIFIGAATSKSSNVKFGFGGFIGPLPFGFANDPRLLWVIIGISVIVLAAFLIQSRLLI